MKMVLFDNNIPVLYFILFEDGGIDNDFPPYVIIVSVIAGFGLIVNIVVIIVFFFKRKSKIWKYSVGGSRKIIVILSH